MKYSKPVFFLIVFMAVILTADQATAQCVMCKSAAEQSLKEGSTIALGLNKGIFYLASFPYLICMALFFLWYRNYRKRKAETPAG